MDSSVRLVALGDSIVNGYTVPARSAWPALLQAALREQWPATGWVVVNRGVCGETVLQGLARLERDALRLRPAALLVAFGLNDCYLARSPTDIWREAEAFPELVYGPHGGSRLFRAARRRLWGEAGPWEAPDDFSLEARVRPEIFQAALVRIVAEARGAGVPHIYLLTMTPVIEQALTYWPADVQARQAALYDECNDHIRQTATAQRVGLIDAQAGFAGADLRRLITSDGVHLNAAGQQVLAAAVFDQLQRDGLPAILRPS
jgi:lysophospholipase L1-like esterase